MENDKRKLFVGGITRETSEDDLKAHFQRYGAVWSSIVAKDKTTLIPRGFGFVVFSDPSSADLALRDSHVILGRTVDVKKAVPRTEQHQCQQQQQYYPYQQRNNGIGNYSGDGGSNDCFRNKKIFVGGLPASLTEQQFKNYFERFGNIVDVVVMQDSSTNRPRGFGFVTFDSDDSVERVMVNARHELNGRSVEVKRALPKDEINCNGNCLIPQGGVRGSSNGPSQAGMYSPYCSVYDIRASYAPFPGYGGFGGYLYGTDAYGCGYPLVGYGRTGFGVTPIVPNSAWNGHMMLGPGMCALPCNNDCLYPTYMNGGVSTDSPYNGSVVPALNGNLNHVPGGNGLLLPSGTPPSSEELNLEVKASGLSNGGALSLTSLNRS